MRKFGQAGWIAAALLLLGVSSAAQAQYGPGPGRVVRCESRDYRQVYCDVDARGGARIVRQLSDTACIEGRNWGWDRRGIWVSAGCRAEFELGGRPAGGPPFGGGHGPGPVGGGQIVRCESRDYAQVYCAGDTRGGVRLVRQLSSSACVEGRTWGADRRGLWVRGGCRGEFEFGRGGGPGGHWGDRPGSERLVLCESRDNRYRHCPTRIGRNVELVRQISSSSCVYNRSWGYDRNGIWVDRGCRAEFVVH